MYYQSLSIIETSLSKSKRKEDRMISRYVSDLDEWLITRPKRYKYRLNPLQFSLDYDVSDEISDYLFELGLERELFDVYYEAETDFKEPLGAITQKTFNEILKRGKIIIEHPFEDKDYVIYPENIQILFALTEKPIKEFLIKNDALKKVIAPALTVNKANNRLRKALLKRGTGE